MGASDTSPAGVAVAVARAWASAPTPPDLAEVLPAHALGDDELLAEALVADAGERLARGHPASLETYARSIPALLTRREACRALLMHELARRREQGDMAAADDLRRRLPDLREDIDLVEELCELVGDSMDPPASPAPFAVGQRFGRHTLIDRLGAGAFGEVWRAWDDGLQRSVALKLLFPAAGEEQGEALERALREARAAAALDHEHIVKVYSAGMLDGADRHFIESQLVGDPAPDSGDPRRVLVGAPLDVYAERERPGPRACAQLMERVCRAVAAAHAHSVLHRDLKPGNILVTPSGKPMVADFGLSVSGMPVRDIESAGKSATTTTTIETPGGRIVGTPAYLSPEQAGGAPATPLSDVYALGATLRCLLTGAPPFEPSGRYSADARWDVIEQVRRDEPRSAVPLGRAVPRTLAAICDKAMARRPLDRYVSAAQMGEDLERYLQHRPTLARPAGPIESAALWARRHRAPATVALAAALALALVGARYIRDVARERDRALVAERLAETRLKDARNAEGVAREVNEFMQGVLGAADPRQAGKDVTVLAALDKASEKIDAELKDHPEVEAGVRTMIGRTYRTLDDPARAAPHLERAVSIWDALGAEDRPEALRALHELALLRFEQRRFDECVSLLESVVEMRGRALPPDHEETLTAINDLGTIYRNVGRLEDAERTLTQSVAARERVFGPDHPRTIAARRGLAGVLFVRGKPEAAEPMLRRAAEDLKRTVGPRAIESLLAINDLGVVLRAQKKSEEAASCFREAYEGYRETLPVGHTDALSAGMNLVSSLRDLKRAEEGLAVAQELLSAARAGASAPSRAPFCLAYVGGCLADLERYAEARDALTEAAEGLSAGVGDAHRTTQGVLGLLVRVHTALGEPEKARAYEARLARPPVQPANTSK